MFQGTYTMTPWLENVSGLLAFSDGIHRSPAESSYNGSVKGSCDVLFVINLDNIAEAS